MTLADPAWLGLFANAFLAATILPIASEPLAIGLVASGRNPWIVWLVATIGNAAGAVVGWWLGRAAMRWRDRPWFPASRTSLERAERWFARWGRPALLASWLPIVGDALTVVAGALRTPLGPFLLLVGLGKAARYALVLAPTSAWLGP
ncbi:MAG: DedA family protein [Geminicoccaceae bacterium]|nr:DedA family protein [Geminicoccaceae bacterium]MCX8101663.1 DedA family protein [Geminicoccaceae bacterium]MDW8371677.1 YqaA family protein [Geminicoccaceae bacterium]